MATQRNAVAKAIMGSGDIRLDLYDPITQTWGGLSDILEADKFEITPDSELKEKTSKSRAAYGQSIAAVSVAKPTKIAITISSASVEAMAMQFQGVAREVSQGAGAIDDTVVAKLDKWAKLSKGNVVEAGFTVKNKAGSTTYDKDTDYVVNYATGEIKPLSSGAIAANEELKVAGTVQAYTSTVISGGVRAQVRVRAIWEGENIVDGQYIEVEAWECVLTSGNGFDFLADSFNGIELTGSMVVPAGKTSPYEIRLKHPAA